MSHCLSIVIPCQNEEEAIPSVLDQLQELGSSLLQQSPPVELEVIVVNDASTDQSLTLLESHPSQPQILTNEVARGYGGALKRGIAQAKGEVIGFLDMDDTYPPMAFQEMLELLYSHQLDMIAGERRSNTKHMPLLRRIGNSFFTGLCRILFQADFKDCATGQRLFHSRHKPLFLNVGPDGLDFALVMTLYAHTLGLKTLEISIPYQERVGQSKLGVIREGFLFLKTILTLRWSSLMPRAQTSTYLKKP